MASLIGYEEASIIIYPFGGTTKYNGYLNSPILSEFIILIGGPLFQEMLYIVILFLYRNNMISDINYNIFEILHNNLLFFNLLPIIPLDGSKFILLILEKIFPYKLSNVLIIIISFITIFLLSAFEKRVVIILLSCVLVKSIIEEANMISMKFNKFLLERYLYSFKLTKGKIIKKIDQIKRGKKHKILCNNRILNEDEYLKYIFKKQI